MMLNIGTTVFLGLLPTFAVGQVVTTAATCSPGYGWMFNSLSQSPCVVAASLAAPCWSGTYSLPVIPGPGYYYRGGAASGYNTPCECSSVFYSVLSACEYCQIQDYLSWSAHRVNCSVAYIYNQVYPYNIPNGLQVPSWAYMDVVTSDFFNVTLARLMSTSTTSSASTRPSVSYPPSPILTPVLTTITPKSNSKKLIGGIVGGVVGGLIIIGSVVGFCLVRKRRRLKGSTLGSSPNGLMQQSLDSQAMTINFTGGSSNNIPPHFPGSPEV